ncbi:DMT family transporter [Gryllotalpicola sp.]|uniref:DMT family transporter n=1 Tax=Gryllotalpicola sp. TaxID=1932787 RepID=UPI002637C7B9|nr:DMT family transporter [Gryllotalpicola sp.]
MGGSLSSVAQGLALDPKQFIGIPIALAGAILLALGTQFQSRGVTKVGTETGELVAAAGGLGMRHLGMLLKRPTWIAGTALIGIAIVLQLTSLAFAPLMVVQPIGAFGLVVTAVLNSWLSQTKLNTPTITAICLCVGGVGVFVIIAAFTSRDVGVTESALVQVLAVLGWVLAACIVGFVLLRKRLRALVYVIGAGVLYGFVATLAKVVISRTEQGAFGFLTAICILALLVAVALGAYFVQNAYASGPPDLVMAGLTVIDPMVAVTIGIVILNEAAVAQGWTTALFVVTGLVAIVGVLVLARYHPQARVEH